MYIVLPLDSEAFLVMDFIMVFFSCWLSICNYLYWMIVVVAQQVVIIGFESLGKKQCILSRFVMSHTFKNTAQNPIQNQLRK